MLNFIKTHKNTLFYWDVFISLIFWIFFATDIIHVNVKMFLYTHLPMWLNWILIIIDILIFWYLYPQKGE
jgi:uncharacterized protein with PQ loop repeat